MRGYSGMALTVARGIVSEESVAREIVKDSMLQALSAVDSAPRDSSLAARVRRIVVDTAIARRNGASEGQAASIENLLPTFDAEGRFAGRAAAMARPAQGVSRPVTAPSRVRECIGQLPEGYRVVLILREFGEMDTTETAATLGITPAEVKTRLHRARLALMGLLAGAVGDLGLGGHAVEAS